MTGPRKFDDGEHGPIDPSTYRSWIYIKHNVHDDGRRYEGWEAHNELFVPKKLGTEVEFKITFANAGWGAAPLVNVDIFVPLHPKGWLLRRHDDALAFASGDLRDVTYVFTAGPGYGEDGAAPSFQPSLVVRISDFFTPVPTQAEITKCLDLFATDRPAAIDTMRRWKALPGFFVYPCCALF